MLPTASISPLSRFIAPVPDPRTPTALIKRAGVQKTLFQSLKVRNFSNNIPSTLRLYTSIRRKRFLPPVGRPPFVQPVWAPVFHTAMSKGDEDDYNSKYVGRAMDILITELVTSHALYGLPRPFAEGVRRSAEVREFGLGLDRFFGMSRCPKKKGLFNFLNSPFSHLL